MTLPFNTFRTLPALKDLLDVLKRDIFLTLNCHHVASVQSFDSSKQTIKAQINYTRTIADSSGKQTPLPYPLIADVPVISLCGGSTSLTFPIKDGDQCLILFNDRDMDNWIAGARSGQVNSPRLHSFSDGIALVGLNQVSSYDAIRALLSNGTVKLGINPVANKVLISNGTSLGTLLGNLCTALQTFSSGLNPSTLAAQAAALNTSVTLLNTEFGALLE